jgi:hypothetical protein
MNFKPVNYLNTKELKRLLKMAQKDGLDFSPELIKRRKWELAHYRARVEVSSNNI